MFLGLFALSGCQTRYETGAKHLAQDRLYDAEKEARYGLKEDPKDARMHLLLARALIKQAFTDPNAPDSAKLKQAEPHALAAFEARDALPSELRAEAGRTLGKIHWELGRPADAVGAWRAARAHDLTSVSDADYLYALRTALTQAVTFESYEQALAMRQELKDLLAQRPALLAEPSEQLSAEDIASLREATSPAAFRETRESYAQSQSAQRRLPEAIALYQALANDYPDEPLYHEALGKLYLLQGKEEEADAAFARQLALLPEGQPRLRRLGELASFAEQQRARGMAMRYHQQLLQALPPGPTQERQLTVRRLIALALAVQDEPQAQQLMRQYLDLRKEASGKLTAQDYRVIADMAAASSPALALAFLEEALEALPADADITRRVTSYHAQNARHAEVERLWKRFVERQGESRQSMEIAAQWARQRRSYELAEHFYAQIAQRNGSSADWLNLAHMLAQQAKTEELRKAVSRYLDLARDDRRALRDASDLYMEQNLFEDAERVFERGLKKYPKDYSLAEGMANMYLQWGKAARVHDPFKLWLKARGNLREDIRQVAEFFLRQNRLDEALVYFKSAADKGIPEAYLRVASIHQRQQRDREMRLALDDYLARHHHRPTALREAYNLYQGSSLADETASLLKELITLEPRNMRYYEHLIRIYRAQGRERESLELIQAYLAKSSDPMRDLEGVARQLVHQHGDLLIKLYPMLLAAQNPPNPRLYLLIGDNLYTMHYRQSQASRMGMSAGPSSVTPRSDYLERAEQFYTQYLSEASLDERALVQFARQMKDRQFMKLAAQAYERALGASKRPQPSLYLDYGDVLFALNEPLKGQAMFQQYYDKAPAPRSPSMAMTTAERLMRHGRFEAAEPYLKLMLKETRGTYGRNAFNHLAHILLNADRPQDLGALIEEFMRVSARPAESRRFIKNTLLSHGQWDLAVEQLEQLAKTERQDMRFEIAQTLYRAQKQDRAAAMFAQWANEQRKPEEAWLTVASFYEQRAALKPAQDAYERAITLAPSDWRPRAARARFAILQGRLKAGQDDLKRALAQAPPDRQEQLRRTLLDALVQTGHTAQAAAFARESLPFAIQDKDAFVEVLASHELGSGDPLRAERMVQELRRMGLQSERLVSLLEQHGYHDDAISFIEEEIAVGDPTSATRLVITSADLFTRRGGMERLLRAVQPLLDRPREQPILEAALGEYLVREGHLEHGALYLRAALDRGQLSVRWLLAQAYLELGQWEQAAQHFQAELATIPESERHARLRALTARYRLRDAHEPLRQLLTHLAQDQRFTLATAPQLVADLLDRGDLHGAISQAQRVLSASTPASPEALDLLAPEGISAAQRLALFLELTRVIASRGHLPEAISLLTQAPLATQSDPALQSLLVRLEALSGAGQVQERLEKLEAALDSSMESERKRVELAQLMLLTGHVDQAKRLGERAMASLEPTIAADGFNLMARVAYVSKRPELIMALAQDHLRAQTDKTRARQRVIETLHQLGLDAQALTFARETAQRLPTEDHARVWLDAAHKEGDAKAFKDATTLLWHVGRDPLAEVEQLVRGWVWRADSTLATLVTPVRVIYPAKLEAQRAEAELALRAGDVTRARERWLGALERASFDPGAVEAQLTDMLQRRLVVEMTRTLAPKLPEGSLTARGHLALGLAHAALKDPGSQAHLEAFAKSGPDPSWTWLQISEGLLALEQHAQALTWIERAIKRAPDQPHAYHLRALAHVHLGKPELALRDAERALDQGIGRAFALARLIEASLKAGQLELAERFTLMFVRSPAAGDFNGELHLRHALSLWSESAHAARAVKFLEAHYPELLTGRELTSLSMATALSNVYEGAGMIDLGFAVYEQAMRRQLIEAPYTGDASTYMNNLAYTYSTTNKHIDRGEQLILTAMATDSRRSSSFIDTLGWIYYRQGKLKLAQDEIQRAIRASGGEGSGDYRESYMHLAEILDARGKQDEAAWLRAYVETLR